MDGRGGWERPLHQIAAAMATNQGAIHIGRLVLQLEMNYMEEKPGLTVIQRHRLE